MEPGHEDREYETCLLTQRGACAPQWSPVMKTGNTPGGRLEPAGVVQPQWSPVMKTGNTRRGGGGEDRGPSASMEPGHEDREYRGRRSSSPSTSTPQWSPVMKTGNTRTVISTRRL